MSTSQVYGNLLKQRENVRERERERGREREWNIVRNRRRGRLRMEPIERTDPRLSYEGNRHGQQPKYHHANWRDGTDITSFYFTRFPEDTTVKELWTQFKKWGEVRDKGTKEAGGMGS